MPTAGPASAGHARWHRLGAPAWPVPRPGRQDSSCAGVRGRSARCSCVRA